MKKPNSSFTFFYVLFAALCAYPIVETAIYYFNSPPEYTYSVWQVEAMDKPVTMGKEQNRIKLDVQHVSYDATNKVNSYSLVFINNAIGEDYYIEFENELYPRVILKWIGLDPKIENISQEIDFQVYNLDTKELVSKVSVTLEWLTSPTGLFL